MSAVDPQDIIDRGLRLDPDAAARLAQRVLDAQQQIANVRALHEEYPPTGKCLHDGLRWPCFTVRVLNNVPNAAALDGPAAPPQEPHPTPEAAVIVSATGQCREPSKFETARRHGGVCGATFSAHSTAEVEAWLAEHYASTHAARQQGEEAQG